MILFKINFPKNSFGNTIRVSHSLDPDQARHLSGLIWVQAVCKGYQQKTKVAASKERVQMRKSVFLSLATRAYIICNFIPLTEVLQDKLTIMFVQKRNSNWQLKLMSFSLFHHVFCWLMA